MPLSTLDSKVILRPFWAQWTAIGWKLGLALILLFGIPRFVLVLGANISGNYNLVSIIFVLMWIAPFILLKREGRRAIGLRVPTNARWLFYGLVIGISGALAMYLIGHMLYGDSLRNWFVYISGTYSIPGVNLEENRLLVFLIFATVSMTFSPIGEEFMYRGLIHASFVPRFGENAMCTGFKLLIINQLFNRTTLIPDP